MRGFLVPGERKGSQGLESLIILQHVESDETLAENTIRVSSRRGVDQVKDLRGHLLRKNRYHVVELGLAYCHVPDRDLSVCLSKPDFRCVWPENRQLHRDVGCHQNF